MIKDEQKRATSIQKHRSFGFDNCAFAAQQSLGVLSFLSEVREFMIILILLLLGRI